MTEKKLPLTSMPIRIRGVVCASIATAATDVVKAVSPSKVVLRSRMSTILAVREQLRFAVPIGRSDRQDCGGPRHPQRPEQEGVGEAEHRAVGADADRQGDHGDEREPGAAREHPAAVADVARQILEPGEPALVAQRFHRLRDRAGPSSHLTRGVVGGQAAAARLVGGELGVQPQLVLEVVVGPAPADGSPQSMQPLAQHVPRPSARARRAGRP